MKTKTELFTLINTNIPNNTNGLITPEKVREVETQAADSALNLAETSVQTVAGSCNFTGGLKKGGNDVIIGAREVEVLRAYSLAASQLPTALGTALQIEFGALQSGTHLSLAANGTVTCNITGTYAFRIKLQKGRSGASGTSILLSRILVNDIQVGVSAAAKMTSADPIYIVESKVTLALTAGSTIKLQIIRDSSGANFGGLYSVSSTDGWNIAPSALLVASRIEGVV